MFHYFPRLFTIASIGFFLLCFYGCSKNALDERDNGGQVAAVVTSKRLSDGDSDNDADDEYEDDDDDDDDNGNELADGKQKTE